MSKTKKRTSSDFFNNNFFDETPVEKEIDNFEKAANEEISEHMLSIREATANSRKSLEDQWNTDFYFCAFFADQEQRDEFLQKAKAIDLVKDNFINGAKLAELLGIDLTPKDIKVPKLFAPKKDWFDITM